ncbi:MAG: cation transporter [Methylococcaceae bacterium]
MMVIKTALLILSLLSVSLFVSPAHAEAAVQVRNGSQSVILDIRNMTCEMCKFTIKKALQSIEGVQQVSVDYASKTAAISFDPQKTGSEALIKASADAGYPATVRPPTQ